MENKKLQKLINETFSKNFGKSPLKERLSDIQQEFFELNRYSDINNLKEETGDLISSLIQLCNECGWDFEDVVNNTLEKINRRENQYKSLGRKYKVALLGGAFNPITNGHIEVAKFVLNTSKEFDEVWLIPAYKHMNNKKLVDFDERFKMCELAIKNDPRIKVFDYEKRHNLAGKLII
jgi:cytidyltransferase-like protein